jgi:hypothetical protein
MDHCHKQLAVFGLRYQCLKGRNLTGVSFFPRLQKLLHQFAAL